MFTPPDDLEAGEIGAALRSGWSFDAQSLPYQAVGFGSHHWIAADGDGSRLFVTVDDLQAKLWSAADSEDAAYDRLRSAFDTAYALRTSARLGFVLAPVPDVLGQTVRRIRARYSLAVHPFVPGEQAGPDGEFRTDADREAALDILIRLHSARCAAAPSDDFSIQGRDGLELLMGQTDRSWDTGPYGERARQLLLPQAASVERLLAGYDRLAEQVASRPDRVVVTHGEPHASNVMQTPQGLLLVDWDTVALAPPERDLWHLGWDDESVLSKYARATRRDIDRAALSLYRLRYDLAEISGYLGLFHAPHADTADAAESWRNLVYFLQPADRWPELAG